MARSLVAFLVMAAVSTSGRIAAVDDADATAILARAMKALGGEDRLGKIEAATWKARGKTTFRDDEARDFNGLTTFQGLDRFRSEIEVEFRDKTTLKLLAVLNGDRAWHSVGELTLFPNDAVARLKRRAYLTVVPVTLAPLKGPGFKVAAAGEEHVGGRPAAVLKVTGPDGRDLTLSFDKESGLPVKAVGKVFTLDGREITQETTYGDYKDFGGIKVATRLGVKSDGKPGGTWEIAEFQVLDKVDPLAFSVPKEAEREASTVPGPESDKLLPATTGHVLFAFGADQPDGLPVGDIVAVQLPTLKATIVRPTTPENPVDSPTIHALSGPDAEGRIAYIEDHFFVADEKNRRHSLKTIRLDGTRDTELFTRPGDAMWAHKGEIGDELALSPVGGRVAFRSGLVNVQMPLALVNLGTVEIWDVEKKARTGTSLKVLEGLAWFPDGKRLAYVKFVDPKVAAARGRPTDSFVESFRGWDQVPVVFIRDVDAETESFLHVGWHPVVSLDGRSVLVADKEYAWRRVDAATGKSIDATWPGQWMPIASPTESIVLSLCLPTKGMKIRFTEHNSPLVGPKEMLSLKLARVNTNEFQTVVPDIDPRTRVSFGQVRQKGTSGTGRR
jgi:hypothetical protein